MNLSALLEDDFFHHSLLTQNNLTEIESLVIQRNFIT